jgi:signal peptidase II
MADPHSSPPHVPAARQPESVSRHRHPGTHYVVLLVVALTALALDLASKSWATSHLQPGRRGSALVLIEGHLALIRAENHGGAWGLFQQANELLQRPFFLIVNVVAMVVIVSLYRRLRPGQTALRLGLPLVLGGALGNVADRIRFGHVVDFIDMYARWGGQVRHWPTYNVADIAISLGVGLMALGTLWPGRAAAWEEVDPSARGAEQSAPSDDPQHVAAAS